jgi:DNA-binding MarR family transcriptional regulator
MGPGDAWFHRARGDLLDEGADLLELGAQVIVHVDEVLARRLLVACVPWVRIAWRAGRAGAFVPDPDVAESDAVVCDLPGGPRGYQLPASAVQDPAANHGALAQKLGIDRTVLTYLIDDLEGVGLVERRPDPADRRSRRVVATDKGRAVLARRQEALRHAEQHLLGILGQDGPMFRSLLQRLACGANVLDPITSACEAVQHLKRDEAGETPALRAGRRD